MRGSHQSEAEKYLGFSEAKLFETIGTIPGLGASEDNEKEKRGRQWFERHLSRLKEIICCSEAVRKHLRASSSLHEDVQLVAVIADLIAGLCGVVPPFCVSALVCKRGVRLLCAEES